MAGQQQVVLPAQLPPVHHPVPKRAMHIRIAGAPMLDDVTFESSAGFSSLCKVQATTARPNSCLLFEAPPTLRVSLLEVDLPEG